MLSAYHYAKVKEGIANRMTTLDDVEIEALMAAIRCEQKAANQEGHRHHRRAAVWRARAAIYRQRAADPVYLELRLTLNLAANAYAQAKLDISDMYPTIAWPKHESEDVEKVERQEDYE